MLYHNGQAAVIHVAKDPKQESYKYQPNMGAQNALANYPKAVIWKAVQVSQSLLWNKKELSIFHFIQSTVLYQHGPAAARRADQEPKEEVYKSKPNMGACNALANFLKAVIWEAVQVSQSFF